MSKRPYSYTVLRYVHDVVTGEFVNVGLVLFAPPSDGQPPVLRFEFKDRISRIRGMFPDVDRRAFLAAMQAIRRHAKSVRSEVCRDDLFLSDLDAVAVAHKILPHDGSSLRWSSASAGVASDLEKVFLRATKRMLSTYDRTTSGGRTDEDVWRPVRQALVERKVDIEFEAKVIHGSVDTIEFRHSWKNGKIHAYEPLSFDLADADRIKDKARKWLGHLASVQIGSADEFQAYFIAGRPSKEALLPAYRTALEILRNAPSNPGVYEEAEIESLVNSIEDEFRHHNEKGRPHA